MSRRSYKGSRLTAEGDDVREAMARYAMICPEPNDLRWLIGRATANLWHETYSSDLIMDAAQKPSGHALRGLVEIEGGLFVCTGTTSTGRRGLLELDMVEAIPTMEWGGPNPIPYHARFSRHYMALWGRGHYSMGPYRLKGRGNRFYVLGWDWKALVTQYKGALVASLYQGNPPARPLPFEPEEIDEADEPMPKRRTDK